ncbi:hypothetical protein NKG05_08335 [Oerskovia sp. M15]
MGLLLARRPRDRAAPSWGYARSMGERMGAATSALDIQTGGGEVLAGVPRLPV